MEKHFSSDYVLVNQSRTWLLPALGITGGAPMVNGLLQGSIGVFAAVDDERPLPIGERIRSRLAGPEVTVVQALDRVDRDFWLRSIGQSKALRSFADLSVRHRMTDEECFLQIGSPFTRTSVRVSVLSLPPAIARVKHRIVSGEAVTAFAVETLEDMRSKTASATRMLTHRNDPTGALHEWVNRKTYPRWLDKEVEPYRSSIRESTAIPRDVIPRGAYIPFEASDETLVIAG